MERKYILLSKEEFETLLYAAFGLKLLEREDIERIWEKYKKRTLFSDSEIKWAETNMFVKIGIDKLTESLKRHKNEI